MPFDPILSVGYSPRTNPAFIGLSQSADIAEADTEIFTLTFTDNVEVNFLVINVNFNINSGGATIPTVTLKRNDLEIDRLAYEDDFNEIVTNTGRKVLYSITMQRADLMQRNDAYIVTVTTGAGVATSITLTTNINIIGSFV